MQSGQWLLGRILEGVEEDLAFTTLDVAAPAGEHDPLLAERRRRAEANEADRERATRRQAGPSRRLVLLLHRRLRRRGFSSLRRSYTGHAGITQASSRP